MRKRVSEIVAAALLCACLALAGTMALAVAGLLNDGPTAQAQESGGGEGQQSGDADGADGGEGEPELTEWQKARIARYQAARAAAAVSGQAATGLISGLDTIEEGGSDSFTVGADALTSNFNYRYDFFLRASGNRGIGFNSACTLQTQVVLVPRGSSSYYTTLTLHGCKAGTYTLTTHLTEESIGEDEEAILETDIETVTVEPAPTPTTPAPVDEEPAFRDSINNQAWTRNSRISTLTLPAATGGDAPLTYSLSPSLPSGVTRSGLSVSGTPTVTKSRTQYTWTVTDNNGDKARLTFYVTVALEPPTISISRNQSRIDEGQDAEFTLRASHAPLSSISVKIRVSESGSFIRGTKPTSQRISAGSTSASFSIRTSNDDVYESNGSIAVQVRSGAGYTVGSPSSASITVRSEDPRPTPVPVDKAPSFGTPVSDKTWKQNTRIPSFTLPRATGGDGTLRYSLSPSLPAGVGRSGRSVSGTPTGTMTRTKYTWKVTDSDRTDPDSATLTFYITVNADLSPTFGTATTISDKSWTHNKAITSFRLPQATGGDGALAYSLSRALPAGVSRSGRSVSGTPSALLSNTEFTWTATDSDGDKASLMFDVEVLPQVSIARKKAEIAEGQNAEFTLTASAAPSASLAVTVRVTQSGTFISGTAPTSATISASRTTATLSVPTAKDSIDEADGSVSAEVRTGTGYAVGSAASASVSVRDTPRISIAAGTSPVTEGANATFTITAAGASLSSISVPVSVTQSGAFIKGTAPTSVTIAANGTSATLTVATEDDEVDEPDGSITATLSGDVASPYVVVNGSASASVAVNDDDLPKLAAPTNFTITPLLTPSDSYRPDRRARLSWDTVSNGKGYQVQVRKQGGSWASARSGSMPPTSYEITLDSILINGDGLAQATAYQFRVKAVGDGATYVDSEFSNIVEIRDTPITSINGDSRGRTDGKGQAVVTWNAVPGATAYTLRWRKLRDLMLESSATVSHSHVSWRPQAAKTESDWITPTGLSFSGMTITGLELEEIYAFQLTYRHANGQGFAARESYIWPSTRVAGGNERVAGLPLNDPLPNAIYEYVICDDTFPANRLNDWKNLIKHALFQWESVTNGLVTVRYSTRGCADYSEVIRQVRIKIENSAGFRSNDIRNLLDMLNLSNITEQDRMLNEVIKVNDSYSDLKTARVFLEFATELRLDDCGNASACALHIDGWSTTDILISPLINAETALLNIPGGDAQFDSDDVKFNTCSTFWYAAFVHELGHVLGIRDHASGSFRTVMDYGELRVNRGCSPYPFDIMLANALYRD